VWLQKLWKNRLKLSERKHLDLNVVYLQIKINIFRFYHCCRILFVLYMLKVIHDILLIYQISYNKSILLIKRLLSKGSKGWNLFRRSLPSVTKNWYINKTYHYVYVWYINCSRIWRVGVYDYSLYVEFSIATVLSPQQIKYCYTKINGQSRYTIQNTL